MLNAVKCTTAFYLLDSFTQFLKTVSITCSLNWSLFSVFRGDPMGTGARKLTTYSSSQKASHSAMKRQRRRGEATAEGPSPPQSTP